MGPGRPGAWCKGCPLPQPPSLASMSSDAWPGLGLGGLAECHVWGTLWGGAVYPGSDTPSSGASPNRWPAAWAPEATLPLLSQPLWALAKGQARMGFPTMNVSAWPLPSHTSISWPQSPPSSGLTDSPAAPR